MLATAGGLRYRTQKADFVFHSEHGLETSNFYSVVSAPSLGCFAVSEFGIIATMNERGDGWRILSRSYTANNVRAVPGVSVIGKTKLVIAFEDRLAFFDLMKSVSVLTIERIGSSSLQINPIRKMTLHGDTLYVKTEKAVYSRYMDWDNLAQDTRLSDPASWKQVSAGAKISGLESPDSSKVEVDGKVLTDPVLYESGVSKVKWKVKVKDGYFLVGSNLVAFYPGNGKAVVDYTPFKNYALGEVYELRPVPYGGVIAATTDGRIGYGSVNGFPDMRIVFDGLGNNTTAFSSRMKVLAVLPDGHVFYHVWGWAYMIYSEWGRKLEHKFLPTDGYCFDNFMDNYSISAMAVPAPDNSGFLTTTANNSGYSVVYFAKNGDVRCAKQIGEKKMPQAIYAKVGDDENWWVYVSARNGATIASDGELDLIKFPSPSKKDRDLVGGEVKSYRGISPVPIDMAYDSTTGRLWLVSTAALGYLDEDSDSLMTPTSTNGLRGAEYTSIETDVHGNLWLGTANQGVYRLSQKGKTPDTLSVLHFTARDGLLSDNVADISIDPNDGVAWFAHDKGISFYTRGDLRDVSKNLTDSAKVKFKAYPVPFRPKEHESFIIEGFKEDAVVSIFNRGGALIRSFSGDDVLGGRLEWDGFGKDGFVVTPGVYYYVVRSSGKTKKGKFIVIH